MTAAQIKSKYTPKNIQETIQAISKILTKKRWIQGSEQEELWDEDVSEVIDQSFCLIGAANFIDGKFENAALDCIEQSLPKVPLEYIEEEFPYYDGDSKDAQWGSIPQFNDWRGTTHGKVKAVLKRAEELAKKMDRERAKKAKARRGK